MFETIDTVNIVLSWNGNLKQKYIDNNYTLV